MTVRRVSFRSARPRWLRISLPLLPVLLAACTSSPPSPPSAGALAGKTAAEVLGLALHNASRAATMRFRIVTTGAGIQQTVVGEAGPSGGDVIVTNPSETLHIVVSAGVGYIESDSTGLHAALGLPATVAFANANRWISLTKADSQYGLVANATSFATTLNEFTPRGSNLHLVVKRITGHNVGLITGVGLSDVAVQSFNIQLGVTTQTPVLPIAGTVSVQGNGKTSTQAGAFARWGQPVSVVAPSNAVPLSAINHG